jgi:hypothetical protein
MKCDREFPSTRENSSIYATTRGEKELGKTAEFVTVFSTGLDKQEIIKGMPPFFTMTSLFAGSALQASQLVVMHLYLLEMVNFEPFTYYEKFVVILEGANI